ncbi:MAG: hypothetical protein GVY29_06205 [Spirochaetes bacterium]|jgi:positive regulator of sigma E activity|nr:hypothetical protein [Spirochaetota bacterium]
MIEEQAIVQSCDDRQVVFQIIRTGACDACSLREQCYRNDGVVTVPRAQVRGLGGWPRTERAPGAAEAGAETGGAAGVGESVSLRIPNTSTLRLTGIVYGLPLMAFLIGLLLGYYLLFPQAGPTGQPLGAFASAALLMGATGLGIYRFDRRVAAAVRYEVRPRIAPRP